MDRTGIEQLTEKEKEALRLVFSHPSLDAVARALGVSKSAARQRFSSACTKLRTQDRHAAGRALAEQEGWAPYHNRAGTNEQVGHHPDFGADRRTGSANGLIESLAELLGRRGPSNELTQSQRLVRTVWVALSFLIVLSIVAACMGALGNFGQGLHDRGIHNL